MPSVNIIGAGRVGLTFLRLLGTQAQDIASATRASADTAVSETGHGRAADLDDMRSADIWLLTVPDSQIAIAAAALSQTRKPPAIAIHCSGFHAAAVMAPLGAKGWQLSSAHPNLSFADPLIAATNFSGTLCGIEGDEPAVVASEELLSQLGAETFRIASDRKALYHAAAVFSNNFATVVQAIAREAWRESGVPERIAKKLNASLLKATAENVARLGPVDALTGPAVRGDTEVVERQAELVAEWNEEIGDVYRDLSRLAARLKPTGRN